MPFELMKILKLNLRSLQVESQSRTTISPRENSNGNSSSAQMTKRQKLDNEPKLTNKIKLSTSPIVHSQGRFLSPEPKKSNYYSKKIKEIDPKLVRSPSSFVHTLGGTVVQKLLLEDYRPRREQFFMTADEIIELCEECTRMLQQHPTLLKLEVPLKIFGDTHGQWNDLMKLFASYGSPNHITGDISRYTYLFLGDYVDRGHFSLEIMCLLMALKLCYPNKFYFIRGNHETHNMNAEYGFHEEIRQRVAKGRASKNVIKAFDNMFDMMPLGALLENRILCVHGGIGKIQHLHQIESIQRPCTAPSVLEDLNSPQGKIIADLLWSDPAEDDSVTGFLDNPRGVSVTFGADVVKTFLKNNSLELLIRAHQAVKDGYEYFASGRCITVFSATKYCGVMDNAGAVLVVEDDYVIHPKSVLPSEGASSWKQAKSPPTPMRRQEAHLDESKLRRKLKFLI